MSSIAVNELWVILIDGDCVPGPVPELVLTDSEVGSNVGNGSS